MDGVGRLKWRISGDERHFREDNFSNFTGRTGEGKGKITDVEVLSSEEGDEFRNRLGLLGFTCENSHGRATAGGGPKAVESVDHLVLYVISMWFWETRLWLTRIIT